MQSQCRPAELKPQNVSFSGCRLRAHEGIKKAEVGFDPLNSGLGESRGRGQKNDFVPLDLP